jgi:hypothetical protein
MKIRAMRWVTFYGDRRHHRREFFDEAAGLCTGLSKDRMPDKFLKNEIDLLRTPCASLDAFDKVFQ